MTVPLRAALYLRVSTARQAEHDVSIPDQRRQAKPIASRVVWSWSILSSKPAHPPPMIADPSSSG